MAKQQKSNENRISFMYKAVHIAKSYILDVYFSIAKKAINIAKCKNLPDPYTTKKDS